MATNKWPAGWVDPEEAVLNVLKSGGVIKMKGVRNPVPEPAKPRRPRNAYLFFAQAMSSISRKNRPKIAEMWRNMTTGEKARYVRMMEDDRRRYAQELEAYKSWGPSILVPE